MARHLAQATKNDLDAMLLDILSSIATILVSTGYGFSRANKLAKMAFVCAARSIVLETGPRTNIARIAALTGLTRTDVSKIIRSLDSTQPLIEKSTNRAARVASGWVTDRKFSQRDSKPRMLEFSGSDNAFSVLVREYSGDIPAKAMLIEMKRLGMVRQDVDGYLTLVRPDVVPSRRTTRALKAAIPWINFLAGASTAQTESEFVSRSDTFELWFSSPRQALAAMRALQERHQGLVTAFGQLGRRKKRQPSFSLNISMAVAASTPGVLRSRRQLDQKGKRAKPRK